MSHSTKLRMYGENAATFLIFQALTTTPGAIENVLLRNLKQFGSGKKLKYRQVKEVELWLFPNFGKGSGFGEPDVILLADEDVFWIEVETSIDCQRAAPALRKSLLQLRRFRLLQAALARGSKRFNDSRRIVGKTINDKWQPRPASVRLAGHGVLRQLVRRLGLAGTNNRDHYVLFTINKPKGPGGAVSYNVALKLETDGQQEIAGIERLSTDRCWYAYWHGDLQSTFDKTYGCRLNFDEQYVRIKRR